MARTTTRIPAASGRLTSAAVALLLMGLAALPAVADVNRIVLRINDRIATLYDYERLKADRVRAIARRPMAPERRQELLARVGEVTMRDLYDETLVLSRADQLSIQPSEQALRDALESSKANMGIETEEQFRNALAQAQMTVEDLREQMRRNLMLQEVISREVSSRVSVQEEDLRRYYQSHLEEFEMEARLRLREIVVLESEEVSAEARQELADEVRRKILADELSDEEHSRLREEGRTTGWIDLGWVERGDLDAELAGPALELQAGEVSAPIAGRGGLHLLQAVERRDAGVRPFIEVEDEIRARESNRIFQEELAEYSKELEGRSYIVVDPPPEAAGFLADTAGDERPTDSFEDALEELTGQRPGAAAEEPQPEESPDS